MVLFRHSLTCVIQVFSVKTLKWCNRTLISESKVVLPTAILCQYEEKYDGFINLY